MPKYVRITMSDESQWDVPAKAIAASRANYFTERDPATTLQDEFEYTISDDHELIDWAGNNMNWDQIAAHARRVEEPHPLVLHVEWMTGQMEVIER